MQIISGRSFFPLRGDFISLEMPKPLALLRQVLCLGDSCVPVPVREGSGSCPATDRWLHRCAARGLWPYGQRSSFYALSEFLGKLLWIGVAQGELCWAARSCWSLAESERFLVNPLERWGLRILPASLPCWWGGWSSPVEGVFEN